MLEIEPDIIFSLPKDIILKDFPDLNQYYCFNIRTGDQYELNYSSHWILEKIQCSIGLQDLICAFVKEFDITPNEAEMDVAEVIDYALKSGIIKGDRQ